MNTNVNTSNSLICYDILELGKQLQPIGMLVVLDSILNRITANRTKGKNTYIFIDEIYLLFQYEYSANFLFTLWKRVRKYGAFCTGITQNVEDLLQSHTARTMLANSEFIIMLNQASTDRIELAKLLNISDLQMSYITNVGAGEGLIKVGSSLVPFVNKFPKNTRLYTLMTTKPEKDLMNKKYKFILMLLIVLFAISSYFFIKEIAENKKENNIYEDLQEIVKNEENSIQENDYTNASEDKSDNISTENNTNPDDFYKFRKHIKNK